jgi:hypothetical protein
MEQEEKRPTSVMIIALDSQTDSVSGPTVLATVNLRTEEWEKWSANDGDAERLATNRTKQQDWKASFIDYGNKQRSHKRSLYL